MNWAEAGNKMLNIQGQQNKLERRVPESSFDLGSGSEMGSGTDTRKSSGHQMDCTQGTPDRSSCLYSMLTEFFLPGIHEQLHYWLVILTFTKYIIF